MIGEAEIRALMAARRWTQTQLALEAGVTQPTVSRWLSGQVPDAVGQERLAALIGGVVQPKSGGTPPPEVFGNRDLPVFAATEGGPGEMVIHTDPIDYVPRPWFLGQVKDGYAVLIVGQSMEPAFEPGDMALVNPRLPTVRGKTYIFAGGEEHGEFRSTIKRLVNWTATEWRVAQYNPAKEFTLPRAEWPRALRVLGRLDGV